MVRPENLGDRMRNLVGAAYVAYEVGKLRDQGATEAEIEETREKLVADWRTASEAVKKYRQGQGKSD